jgi:hypothetical protein
LNERIRELWSQAGGHYDSGNQHTWPQYTIDDPEKFAELIVRECVAIANRQFCAATGLDDRDCLTAHQMKQHFGVEE